MFVKRLKTNKISKNEFFLENFFPISQHQKYENRKKIDETH